MKKVLYVFVLIVIFMLSACALHIPPYDLDWESPVYRIRLLVDPDDAVVLVNGRMKGYSYEFSTWNSALRLASRNNEVIVKKEGYVEEPIDLYNYYSRKITVRLKLLKDNDLTRPVSRSKPPKPPKQMPEGPIVEKAPVKTVDVFLEILPEEASIYLNGKFWGISPRSGKIENLRLKPGKYSLEVVKPGYKAYKKELKVVDKKLKLFIKLQK